MIRENLKQREQALNRRKFFAPLRHYICFDFLKTRLNFEVLRYAVMDASDDQSYI